MFSWSLARSLWLLLQSLAAVIVGMVVVVGRHMQLRAALADCCRGWQYTRRLRALLAECLLQMVVGQLGLNNPVRVIETVSIKKACKRRWVTQLGSAACPRCCRHGCETKGSGRAWKSARSPAAAAASALVPRLLSSPLRPW
jgi:hypothetical protein